MALEEMQPIDDSLNKYRLDADSLKTLFYTNQLAAVVQKNTSEQHKAYQS